MITIYATITGHQLLLGNSGYVNTQVTLPTGSELVDVISTTFSGADWSSATSKEAAFWRKDEPSKVYVSGVASNSVTVPAAVTQKPGIVYVAFAGTQGSSGRSAKITTNAAPILIEQGYQSGT